MSSALERGSQRDLLGARRGNRRPQRTEPLRRTKFADIIEELTPAPGEGHLVLIFDQFEELLSIDPTDWKNQKVFFRELGTALQDGSVWTLFSMREDYMGGLDRFIRYIPGHLQTTYRLDFLDRHAARVAIQRPARERNLEFADDEEALLVTKLGKVLVARPCEAPKEVDAPYIQPFQLQVVCRRLWTLVERAQGDDFSAIGLQDVKNHTHISTALADYYAAAVADVARDTGVDEMAIRRWFEQQLITRDGFRTQTLMPPESGQADSGELLRRCRPPTSFAATRAAIPRGTSYLMTHSSALSSMTTESASSHGNLLRASGPRIRSAPHS
jgi:hypothetical protein